MLYSLSMLLISLRSFLLFLANTQQERVQKPRSRSLVSATLLMISHPTIVFPPQQQHALHNLNQQSIPMLLHPFNMPHPHANIQQQQQQPTAAFFPPIQVIQVQQVLMPQHPYHQNMMMPITQQQQQQQQQQHHMQQHVQQLCLYQTTTGYYVPQHLTHHQLFPLYAGSTAGQQATTQPCKSMQVMDTSMSFNGTSTSSNAMTCSLGSYPSSLFAQQRQQQQLKDASTTHADPNCGIEVATATATSRERCTEASTGGPPESSSAATEEGSSQGFKSPCFLQLTHADSSGSVDEDMFYCDINDNTPRELAMSASLCGSDTEEGVDFFYDEDHSRTSEEPRSIGLFNVTSTRKGVVVPTPFTNAVRKIGGLA